jgi:hypothetical protein
LIGFLLGTLIESRKENEHLSSVIGSLPIRCKRRHCYNRMAAGLA